MNITELKELAEKATPGPWHRMANKDFGPISASDDQSFGMFIDCGSAHSDDDANYIAAAHPAAILELIADRDSWEQQASDRTDDAVRFATQLEDAQGEIRALRATEQNLRERVKALEEGLKKIDAIEHQMYGADWEEIEEAQEIARALLEQKP